MTKRSGASASAGRRTTARRCGARSAGEFPEPLLLEAGLLRRPEDGGAPYDYFRSRVMFPIGDRAGRMIAFGGRVMGDGQPKYLNSPDTPVFEKGRVLYGWAAARAARGRARSGGDRRRRLHGRDRAASRRVRRRRRAARHRADRGAAAPNCGAWRPSRSCASTATRPASAPRGGRLRRALPLLSPGHSLRFASLPRGRRPRLADPRPRPAGVRASLLGGRGLCRTVLWEIGTRRRPVDTPERRADLQTPLDGARRADRRPRRCRRNIAGFMRERLCVAWRPPHRRARRADAGPAPVFLRDGPRAAAAARASAHAARDSVLGILLQASGSDRAKSPRKLPRSNFPKPELDKLRRAILEIDALRPGLDAAALRQHLLLNGFAATVDALLSPSVDHRGFLVRRPDLRMARDEWAHVIGMLMGGHAVGLGRSQQSPARRCLGGKLGALPGGQGTDVARGSVG